VVCDGTPGLGTLIDQPRLVPISVLCPTAPATGLSSRHFPFALRSDTLRATTPPHSGQRLYGIPVGPPILPPKIWLHRTILMPDALKPSAHAEVLLRTVPKKKRLPTWVAFLLHLLLPASKLRGDVSPLIAAITEISLSDRWLYASNYQEETRHLLRHLPAPRQCFRKGNGRQPVNATRTAETCTGRSGRSRNFHFKGPSRTCSLTKLPAESRESESTAENAGLAAILVCSRESAGERMTSLKRCRKERCGRQLWRLDERKKQPRRLVCRRERLPESNEFQTLYIS